jgi:thioredoxin-like negative regulator of GroEL
MPKKGLKADATQRGARWRRYVVLGTVAVLVAAAVAVFAPGIGSTLALGMAGRRMAACEFGPARGWLAWAAWFDPSEPGIALWEACWHRQWWHRDRWSASLQRAHRQGAPGALVVLEETLSRCQAGTWAQGEEPDLGKLVAAGALPADAATAVLRGWLARGDAERARAFLNGLPKDRPDEAHRDYLWGVYWRKQNDPVQSENRLKLALHANPGHELARDELAAMLTDQSEFDRAMHEYAELAIRSRGNERARIGLARVLRFQGRLEEARAVLAPLVAGPAKSDAVRFEMAWIELESGSAEEAERWLRRLPFDEASFGSMYSVALITLGLRAKNLEARQLYEKSGARSRRVSRISDLQARLTNNPTDSAALEELRRLQRQEAFVPKEEAFGPGELGPETPGDPPTATAAELYARHCSACHGTEGDGYGPAARHLFPRPISLRTGRSVLVSTLNATPTLEDLEDVLRRGMPGTSMQRFDGLTDAHRRLLALEVLRLRREGVREQVARAMRQEGEEPEEADLKRAVEVSTTPGPRVPVPQEWRDDPQAIARGRQSYLSLGCAKCHGDDGRGVADEPSFDDQGEPRRPRDLVYEPFKGGHEPGSIFLRVAAGMPGTPHPAALNFPQGQLVDLVGYVRSLARTPQRVLTDFERRVRDDGGQ